MSRARGFSLIELMVSLTLGLVAIGAVGSVFVLGSRNYRQDDKMSRVQDELRFAMAQLTQDLEMAGFWAQINNPVDNIQVDGSATVTTDCGPTTDGAASGFANNWVYRERRAAVFTIGDATGADAAAAFPCISASQFVDGTDVVAIKRLGAIVTDEAGHDDHSHFRTNGVQATLYRYTGAIVQPTSGTVTIYEYQPVIWYVRNFTTTGENPQVPALCRKIMEGDAMQGDPAGCIASGILDLQLEFGLDTPPPDGDGVADFFTEFDGVLPDINTLARIVAVRVHLLARSAERDTTYTTTKSFQLASKTIPPVSDGYYRMAQSTTVVLRNPAMRLTPFALP